MFANGTFGVVEFLYNGGYNRRPGEVFMINFGYILFNRQQFL